MMPLRAFRAPDPLWSGAQARAEAEGHNLSAVLRAFLAAYAAGDVDPEAWGPRDAPDAP